MSGEVTIYGGETALTPAAIRAQVGLIQTVMQEVMTDGEHYGIIPGTGKKCTACAGTGKKDGQPCKECSGRGVKGKPSLLKAGAEKIMMTFRLVADPHVEVIDLPHPAGAMGHREYRVTVKIYTQSGLYLGGGVGSASTMETKWRFRTGPSEVTDMPVPQEYWKEPDPDKKLALIGGPGHRTKKGEDGKWYIAIQGEKVEHDNPADYYNTCEKMAKKRALVDATLTVTAASDIFTQDVEEMVENGVIVQPKAETATPLKEPQPRSAAPEGTAPETMGGEPVISEAQAKRFYAIAKTGGNSDEDIHAWLRAKHGIASTKAIPKSIYEEVCKAASGKLEL